MQRWLDRAMLWLGYVPVEDGVKIRLGDGTLVVLSEQLAGQLAEQTGLPAELAAERVYSVAITLEREQLEAVELVFHEV